MKFEEDYRRIQEYRKIVEDKIGRKLKSNEVVHHINENYLDNRPENLQVMDTTEHNRMHGIKQWEDKERIPREKWYNDRKQEILKKQMKQRIDTFTGDCVCEECNRQFKNMKSLSNHTRWHKGHWRALA